MNHHLFSRAARLPVLTIPLFDDGELGSEVYLRGATPADDALLRAFCDGVAPLTAKLNVVFRYVHTREYRSVMDAAQIGVFHGNPSGLARVLDQLYGSYGGSHQRTDPLPVEIQGYLCQTPEGTLRLLDWDGLREQETMRTAVSFIKGRPMEIRRGTFRLYAGSRFVAEFSEHELASKLGRFRDIINPANVMAAKDAVRPAVIAAVETNPSLIGDFRGPREDAIEILVGERASDVLYEQCRAAGLVESTPVEPA